MNLYRSSRDKKLFGVCGGLAEAFRIDPTLLRLIVAVATFFSAGTVLLLYILFALVLPKEPDTPPSYGHAPGGWTYPPSGAGTNPGAYRGTAASPEDQAPGSKLDDMMKDIERKALLKEIEELKARLAKLEKQEKGDE
jgi:phage shock protein PspC (stress-responsive transcriptional regulator)